MSNRGNSGPKWTVDEENYLVENAGRMSLQSIASKLKRPLNGVVAKANKLGVSSGKMCCSFYTANQFAKIMGVAASTILHWIELGLKYRSKAYRTSFKYKMIDIKDFYSWGEHHQELIDTRKIKISSFGDEPKWLADKRKLDRYLPNKKAKLWTKIEEQRLITMYESKITKEVMAKELGRSLSGVQRKIDRLKLLGFLPIEKKGEFYTELEEIKLLKFKTLGLTNKEVGQKLGGRGKRSISRKFNELMAKGMSVV